MAARRRRVWDVVDVRAAGLGVGLALLATAFVIQGLSNPKRPCKTLRKDEVLLDRVAGPAGRYPYNFDLVVTVTWSIEHDEPVYVEHAFDFALGVSISEIAVMQRESTHAVLMDHEESGGKADVSHPVFDDDVRLSVVEERIRGQVALEHGRLKELLATIRTEDLLTVTMHLAGCEVAPQGPNSLNVDGRISWSVYPKATGLQSGTLFPKLSPDLSVDPSADLRFTIDIKPRTVGLLKLVLYVLGGSLALPKLIEYLHRMISWWKNRKPRPPEIVVP